MEKTENTKYTDHDLEKIIDDFNEYVITLLEQEFVSDDRIALSEKDKDKFKNSLMQNRPLLMDLFHNGGDEYVDFFKKSKALQAAYFISGCLKMTEIQKECLEIIHAAWSKTLFSIKIHKILEKELENEDDDLDDLPDAFA